MVDSYGKGRPVGGVGILPVLTEEDSEGESVNGARTGTVSKSRLERQTTGTTSNFRFFGYRLSPADLMLTSSR
jgi:hypothetical protein